MKKVLSILFSLIVLMSGLHLSVARHYCGGEMIAWKVSFDQKKATCGMCSHETSTSCSVDMEGCCKDYLSVMTVDNAFQPTEMQNSKVAPIISHTFFILHQFGFPKTNAETTLYANIHPPGNYLPEDVNLAGICVFRI
jgi:hypothetical protein